MPAATRILTKTNVLRQQNNVKNTMMPAHHTSNGDVRIFISRSSLKNFIPIMSESFVIIILNSVVWFHINPEVSEIFIYVGCVGISAMLLLNLCNKLLMMMVETVKKSFRNNENKSL